MARSRRRPARSARLRNQVGRQIESLEVRRLLAGGPVISEFLARNEGPLVDEDGQPSDWIEIQNTSAAPLNLLGWHLTDKDDELEQWTFPSVTLPVGATVIVFASEKDRAVAGSELHTNFKLDGDGEYLALVAPNGFSIEQEFAPEYPNQYDGISYGLGSDFVARGYFLLPTPNAPNTAAPIADPTRNVVISEIMYHPSSNNDLEEYLELANLGTGSVNLNGWQFTSGVDFTFPNIAIPAGQRLVVARDVATFSAKYPSVTNVVGGWTGQLSDGAERITLQDLGGGTIDRVEYADEGDWSVRVEGELDFGHRGWDWSDDHDGLGRSLELVNGNLPNEFGQNWRASTVDQGTPGAANSVSVANSAPLIQDVTQFPIIPRSTNPVTITAQLIDEQTNGLTAAVHWRLDGAANFTTSTMFDDGLHGDGAAGDGVFGAILPAAADGAIIEYYVSATDSGARTRNYPEFAQPMNAPVANRLYQVDDAFDPNAAWTPESQPIYRLIMTDAEREELAAIGRNEGGSAESNALMNATFVVVDGTGSEVRYNAGIRNRGHGSRNGPPNNYHVKLPKDQLWNDVSELNFNCRTVQSQLIGSAIQQFAGLIAADATAAEVRVNGVDLALSGNGMFGSYVLVEQMNGDAMEHHFPADSEGNLYSAFRLDDGSDEADLAYDGPDPVDYQDRYFKETNEETDDWTDLIALTDALNNAPAANYVQVVSQHVNIDQWLRYLALDALLQNRETGLNRGIGDDYQLYRGVNDPRFVLVSHDLDTLLGQGNNVGQIDQSIFTFTEVAGLNRFLNHPEIVPRFYQQFLDLMESTFNSQTLNPLIDQLLGPFVPASNITAMKQFIVNRSAAVLAQIPQQFQINNNLPVVNGVARTTSPSLVLSGVANTVETQSVLADGILTTYNAVTGVWETAGESTGNQADTLSPKGAQWKYLANGSNQGTAWYGLNFNDVAWQSGAAQLGYGDNDEVTVVNSGPSGNHFITTYFRRTFTVDDPAQYTGLILHLLQDDGAVVYLNGTELTRSNLPAKPATINYLSPANNSVGGSDEDAFISTAFAAEVSLLRQGTNVLAVEIHQSGADSSDISFDMELQATRPGTGTGGLPLQPGINRVLVEAYSGQSGTGELVDIGYLDVWYDGLPAANVIWPEVVQAASLDMLTRSSYLPGIPLSVRVEAYDGAGRPLRDLWDATVTLSTDTANVALSTYTLPLRNGVGSALVTPTGSGDFTLTATLGDVQFSRRLTSLAGAPVTNISGVLPGTSSIWSGVVNVTGDVTVPAIHTLQIQPGTLVLFAGNPTPLSTDGADLIVQGKVNALGTAANPITFTAANPSAPWGEIRHQSAQPSQYNYAQISRAGHAPRGGHTNTGPAMRVENSTILFDHVDITDIAGKTMTASGSNLTFTHSQFARSAMGPEIQQSGLIFEDGFIVDMLGIYREDGVTDDNDGIYIHRQGAGQTVRISRSVVAHADDDGIDTLGPDMLMEDLIIRDLTNTNDDPKGITIIEGNNTIRNVLMSNVDIGISAKGQNGSTPVSNNTVDHVTIRANSIGIQAEDKFGIPGAVINFNIRNSIIIAADSIHTDYDPATIVVNYSNVITELWAGTGNLQTNPMFVNPSVHDFRPQPGSPSINAGDPASALDPDGSRADQGYFLSGVAGQVAAPQLIGGALAGNTILAPWRGPYVVTGDVTVPTGATLTVLPGTTVFFQTGTGITFNGGQLLAEGTEHETIRFTRVPGGGNWDGLQFSGSMLDNRLTHAVIEYGVTPTFLGMIGLDNSNLTIDHTMLDHADHRRIRSEHSSLIVSNSVFTDIFPGANDEPTIDNVHEHIWGRFIPAGGHFIIENNVFGRLKGHNDAIDFDSERAPNPIAQVIGNTFLGGGDDALDLTGDAYIEGNTFMHFHKDQYNTDPGQSNTLSTSGGDYTVVRNTFFDVGHVTIVKEGAFMNFVNNTVVNADLSALYFDLAGQTLGPGRGAHVVGSVFQNTPTIFAEVLPTTDAEIHQSIVPAAWLGFGAGNVSEDPRLVDPANGDFTLRPGSPALGTGPNGLDRGAMVPPWASIQGEPPAQTSAKIATLTVGGPGIVQYQYRVNNGAWSAARDVALPIQLTNLANGSYTVYVRGQNVAGGWQSIASPTASRSWTVNASLSSLVISEVLASNVNAVPHQGTRPDVIELFNGGAAAINLVGMSLSDDASNPTKFIFPAMILQPGAYLTLYADRAATPGLHLGFGLDADGDGVFLYGPGPARTLVDSVEFGSQVDDFSIARLGQDGAWELATPTIGAANIAARTGDSAKLSINEWFASGDLLVANDFVELYNPDALPVALGGLYLTDNYGSLPRKHQIAPLSFVAGQGAVAFIADGDAELGPNHLNFRLESQHETLALLDIEGRTLDRVNYQPQTTDVSQGRSPDGNVPYESFTLPTPGLVNAAATDARALSLIAGLRISEIMYNPDGGSDYEYIEVHNTSAAPLDITGVRLGGGVEFVFPAMTLAPGAYAVVAGNLTAFQQRYGAVGNLAGAFDGNLDNAGEALVLQLPEQFDAAILRFDFDDAWYPATDGSGRALVIRNGVAAPHDWRLGASWNAGLAGGTPGRGEVGVPGDTNGDGRVDIQDLNNVRNHFGEVGPNVIGDADGDGQVGISDLNAVRNNFGIGGAAPATTTRRPLQPSAADLVFSASENY
ncbi:MAG: lamin tail domain-containing protein [Planctomycetia bacterium]|nr:lamin tail domain-containing protein [Planctomycetia bacterium]